ncbi:hypothetical protein QTP99_09960 [Caldanaerobacter subterraneus KAk]|jgi:spore coat polysaccharide biosynthesis predicted glycosyltransferase SpsG|uniref:hypothetical protein n=1 Tax=Caldanaerobacter subterraneus TaxID=911092 RepID=UPI0032C05A2F
MKYVIKNSVTGKKIMAGELINDTFYKRVKSSSKLLCLDSHGIEASVVEDLKGKGCKKIILIEDGKKEYSVSFNTFYTKAIRGTFGKSSYQFYLPMKFWKKKDDKKEEMEQISLFDFVEVG